MGHDSWHRGTEVDEEAGEERQVAGGGRGDRGTTRKQVEIKGIKVTRLRQIHGCQLLMCSINASIFVNSSLHWSHLIRMSFRLTHFRTRMKIERHFDPDRDGGFKGSQGPGRVIN